MFNVQTHLLADITGILNLIPNQQNVNIVRKGDYSMDSPDSPVDPTSRENPKEQVNPKPVWPEVPIRISKCPICGCEDTVAKSALRSEQEKGRCTNITSAWLYQQGNLIAPGQSGWLVALIVVVQFDACIQCGNVYMNQAVAKPTAQGMNPNDLKKLMGG